MSRRPGGTRAEERCSRVHDKRGHTLAESAMYLGVSQWAIKEAVAQGKVPARIVGAHVLIDQASLDRYFDETSAARPQTHDHACLQCHA